MIYCAIDITTICLSPFFVMKTGSLLLWTTCENSRILFFRPEMGLIGIIAVPCVACLTEPIRQARIRSANTAIYHLDGNFKYNFALREDACMGLFFKAQPVV